MEATTVSQAEQFPSDLHAPPDWVLEVEGRSVASARWEDGSYGNDAAPSWILVDDAGTVHAQAFYYTSENAERFDQRFGDAPYVALSILRDEEIAESCTMTPDDFVASVTTASVLRAESPVETLLSILRGTGSVVWDRPSGPGRQAD